MIQQLVHRLSHMPGPGINVPPLTKEAAALRVLSADPFDLLLHMEQVWQVSVPWTQVPGARKTLIDTGGFNHWAPATGAPAWDHLGYSYVLENTRAVQVFKRIVHAYRTGESLGIPSVETQRWLDITETLLFGAANPLTPWLSTSSVRPDSEAVRRNAYWRLFGLDLAFGTDDNRPPLYDKAGAANTNFVSLFEELLFELWQAISNVRNTSGVNASDDDRIFRIAEELAFVLRSRRQSHLLAREELAASTVLGWVDLTVSADTPVVMDLRANATSQPDRLKLMGERVGLSAHSRSAALFSMAAELSLFLRIIEAKVVSGPELAWVLYLEQQPQGAPVNAPTPIGGESRRVITEWAAATGRDLKARAKPIDMSRRQLAGVR